jgi:hypothetical protein
MRTCIGSGLQVAFLFVRHGKLLAVNIRWVARTCQPQPQSLAASSAAQRAKWEARSGSPRRAPVRPMELTIGPER